ncbi:hypothetical protein [Streptomyces sp. bgisy034]|uniref:hypothetical protein n=1 Tax=Streptomyces sp. bgisy034 TaxID=3413774 RepID=UPI003EBD5366
MLGGDLDALAAGQRAALAEWGVMPGTAIGTAAGSPAVDLGCGPGHASLALAALGFDSVLAVDPSRPLLGELAAHAARLPLSSPTSPRPSRPRGRPCSPTAT